MKSAPQRLAAPVQSMLPSLKLEEMSCTSLPSACSLVVMGMRIASAKALSMSGTCSVLASADLAAVVWQA
ncbi:MAG: hypothetical protein U1F67_23595 [Rubrivivax sp.]